MVYVTNGSLTTDKREVAESETWDTQSDWEEYQSASGVVISNGVIQLGEPQIFDDFEDGDVAEYSGSTGSFSADTSTVYEGQYSGYLTNSSNAVVLKSTPSFDQGQYLEGRVYCESGGVNSRVEFAAQDTNNGYNIQLNTDQNSLRVRIRSGGSPSTLSGTSVDIPTGEWLRVRVDWHTDNTIEGTLWNASGSELGTVSAQDGTYTSGDAGFGVFDASSYFDYFLMGDR